MKIAPLEAMALFKETCNHFSGPLTPVALPSLSLRIPRTLSLFQAAHHAEGHLIFPWVYEKFKGW